MVRRFSRFLRWKSGDRAALVGALIVLARVTRQLETGSLANVRQNAMQLASRLGPLRVVGRDEASVVRAVRRASRFVKGSRCLAIAITGHALLGARGIPSALRIGVARSPSLPLDAHAWLERDGRALLGDVELERYAQLK